VFIVKTGPVPSLSLDAKQELCGAARVQNFFPIDFTKEASGRPQAPAPMIAISKSAVPIRLHMSFSASNQVAWCMFAPPVDCTALRVSNSKSGRTHVSVNSSWCLAYWLLMLSVNGWITSTFFPASAELHGLE